MAKDVKTVRSFVTSVRDRLEKFAPAELKRLEELKKKEGNDDARIQSWDFQVLSRLFFHMFVSMMIDFLIL